MRYCALAPGRIRSDLGLEIEVPDGLDAMRDADVITVPAWSDPELRAPHGLTEALRQAHACGKLIVRLCLGAFVLGDAGLLDGRKATTHWVVRQAFLRRFPTTDLRPDVPHVEDGNIVTPPGPSPPSTAA